MSGNNNIQVTTVSEAHRLPQFAKQVLDENPVHANLFLPTLHKSAAMEANGQPVDGQLWVVVHIGYDVKFIASCTRGYMGDYPLFIFTPLPDTLHHPEPMRPLLRCLARALTHALSTARIYSVFAAEVVSQTFAAIWSDLTGINIEPAPYYHAKISYATLESVQRFDRNVPSIRGARCEMRPATRADVEGVAEMCFKFAETSPPFTLTWDGAYHEARTLITERQAWVYTATSPDGRTDIASIVAFTRNTNVAATITKVFTHPNYRSLGCAERLVRQVCKYLLSTRRYVVLYVGLNNHAAMVYQRVGFFGIGQNVQPVKGVENYLELGFDHRRVNLGHW